MSGGGIFLIVLFVVAAALASEIAPPVPGKNVVFNVAISVLWCHFVAVEVYWVRACHKSLQLGWQKAVNCSSVWQRYKKSFFLFLKSRRKWHQTQHATKLLHTDSPPTWNIWLPQSKEKKNKWNWWIYPASKQWGGMKDCRLWLITTTMRRFNYGTEAGAQLRREAL